jgi:hypothetical protein
MASCTVLMGIVACLGNAPATVAPDPSIVGRWRIEYGVPGQTGEVLLFEAAADGHGSFLPVDSRRSSLTPATPGQARWSRTRNRVTFSGAFDVPLGNVGVESIELRFEGAFVSDDQMAGDVIYAAGLDPASGAARSRGKFKADRISAKPRTKGTGPR